MIPWISQSGYGKLTWTWTILELRVYDNVLDLRVYDDLGSNKVGVESCVRMRPWHAAG